MLQAINTKILLAILAALGTIGVLLVHQQHETARIAALLEQQQKVAREQERRDQESRARSEAEKRKHPMMPADESKTWRTYIP